MPWYDFCKVTNLRDFLTAANPSAFAYPELITDFACTATLKLSTQFTAEIKLLSETANLRVNFASLLALDLDVSLEFYKLITTMLEGAVGITGMLSIAMKPDDADVPDAEAIDSVEIPFSLKISEIANPQVRFSAPDVSDTDKPMRVVARNTGKHDLTFNTAMPHLLYRDPNAVMPLNVFQARVGQALPLCIAAGQSIELEIQDDPDLKDSVWNSLDMVFSDYSIDIDPKAALQQTYELMPPGDLTWTLTVEVPGMDKIFAVMVEIEVEGRAPITLTLKPDTPRQTFKISPSLKEVMGMDGGVEFLKYVYKTRTVLTDRMLDWTAPAEQQGSSIFIFPAVS
jgi:hypothetical protein